eukprot:TRINITY_DN6069_c0_g1_i2.p1 TRINITY_DN6069_c0_g1~~TRINITY_DN6069_c0_g1_i2.p1  ORF type:complete len:132 (+),score=22.50 TRINITY_DN6069_c0_g1_i2:36-431(+)
MTLCCNDLKKEKKEKLSTTYTNIDVTKDLTQAQIVVSALDLAVQDKEISKFQAKCRLQCYFPEKESQSRRQVDRIKLSCYFPAIEQEQNRRVFRKACLLHCYFPDLENSRLRKHSSLRKAFLLEVDFSKTL